MKGRMPRHRVQSSDRAVAVASGSVGAWWMTRRMLARRSRNSPQQLDTLIVAIGARDEGHQSVQEVLFFFQSLRHVSPPSFAWTSFAELCPERQNKTTPTESNGRVFGTQETKLARRDRWMSY